MRVQLPESRIRHLGICDEKGRKAPHAAQHCEPVVGYLRSVYVQIPHVHQVLDNSNAGICDSTAIQVDIT